MPNAAPHRDARTGLRAAFRPVLDDLGQPIQRLDRRDLVRAARSDDPRLAMLAQRLKRGVKGESKASSPDRVALVVTLVLAVLIGNAAVNQLLIKSAGVNPVFGLLSLIAMILGANRLYMWYVRRGALGQIARTAVAEGVCGSCAFALQGVPTDDARLIHCPECNAAWRAERIVMPYWESTVTPILRRSALCAITPGVRPYNALITPDDRGRFVQTPDARLMRPLPPLLADIPDDERTTLRRAMRRVGRPWRLLLTVPLLIVHGLAAWAAWALWQGGEPVGMWIMLGLVVLLCIPVLLTPAGHTFCAPRLTARVLVRHDRCGSCLLPLANAPTDDQGRRVCPRCGAAWLST
jgi:hypothetical protein